MALQSIIQAVTIEVFPLLLKSTAIVRQSVAISFPIGMIIADFGYVSKRARGENTVTSILTHL